jgi:S-adenosylmethionine synthetase
VDRSAGHICRQGAKSVVKIGLYKRAMAQFSYAIRGAQSWPPLFVETYSTEQGALTAKDIPDAINIAFDCRPDAIALSLELRESLRIELTGNASQMRAITWFTWIATRGDE